MINIYFNPLKHKTIMILVLMSLLYVYLQFNVRTCSKRENGLVDRDNPSTTIDTVTIKNKEKNGKITISNKVKREFVYDGEKADHFLLSNDRRVYLCTIDPEMRGEGIDLSVDGNNVVFVHFAPSFFDSDKIITKDSIVYLIETLKQVYP